VLEMHPGAAEFAAEQPAVADLRTMVSG